VSRIFFALHVFVIPGMLIGFVCLHLLMVLKLGIKRMADAQDVSSSAQTYENEYHQLTRKRWRALCSVCGLERSVLCRIHF